MIKTRVLVLGLVSRGKTEIKRMITKFKIQ